MIETKKQTTVTIDGDDAQTLKNVCECVRVYMARSEWKWGKELGAYPPEEAAHIRGFIMQIFDNT